MKALSDPLGLYFIRCWVTIVNNVATYVLLILH